MARPNKRPATAPANAAPPPARIRIDWRTLRFPLVLALAACALYAGSWHYGFAGDDAFVIVQNKWTQQGISSLPEVVSHSLYFGAVPLNGGLYRPLAGAYYVIVGALVGMRPSGYHIAQILLYGLNVATVFLFLRRLNLRAIAVPAIASVLFLVHPIHTEAVNNIKSADELLCLQFFLMSAIAWLMYADTSRAVWAAASVTAYALAVSSKETAVPMVVVLPALWFFFRQRTLSRSLIAAVPFALVALTFVGLRQLVLSGEPATNIVTIQNNALLATGDRMVQVASAFAYLLRYLRMLFWPHPLSFDYGYNAIPLQSFGDPIVWLAIAALIGLAAVFVVGLKSRRVEAFAVLWFGASMVAVSNVLFLVSTNFGERLLYLPSIVACFVVAYWLARAAKAGDEWTFGTALRSPIVAAPLAVLVLFSAVAGTRRTSEWRDQLTLFSADVKTYPNSARLNNYFGNLLYFQAEQLTGQPHYDYLKTVDLTQAKTHLSRGLAILDTFQEMHAALGMAEYRLKNCSEAIPHLKRSITFATYRESALAMLTDCYSQMGEAGGALALYRQLDADGIEYPQGWFELGNDAATRGDNTSAVRYFSKFIAKEPENVAAYANMAAALRQLNLIGESLTAANKCVALNPTPQVGARCLLIAADDLAQGGRRDEAMKYFERAKALDPNNPWIKR